MRENFSKLVFGLSWGVAAFTLYALYLFSRCILMDAHWVAGAFMLRWGLAFVITSFLFVVIPSVLLQGRHQHRRNRLAFRIAVISLVVFGFGFLIVMLWPGGSGSPVG